MLSASCILYPHLSASRPELGLRLSKFVSAFWESDGEIRRGRSGALRRCRGSRAHHSHDSLFRIMVYSFCTVAIRVYWLFSRTSAYLSDGVVTIGYVAIANLTRPLELGFLPAPGGTYQPVVFTPFTWRLTITLVAVRHVLFNPMAVWRRSIPLSSSYDTSHRLSKLFCLPSTTIPPLLPTNRISWRHG